MTNQTKSQFIAVASITSELSAVMVVAKEISLAAANAKAIAFRAGDKAKGFQPITDFINELAKETIELVTNINIYALVLYR
ncbi:MAG: chemotaxis protein, partial [Methylobacter sp.]